MSGPGRPPPPITIVVPGRGPAPAELLAVGPPQDRPSLPTLSTRLRALVLVAVAVLAAGLLAAGDQEEPVRRAPVPVDASTSYLGVSATAGVLTEQPSSTLLDLVVSISPGAAGHGDSAVQPAQQLRLQGISARGFSVRLTRRAAPLLLDYVGRFARSSEHVLHLPTEVVADCTAGDAGQATILLAVRVTGGPVGAVRVQGSAAVARALDDLVQRSCGRTRG